MPARGRPGRTLVGPVGTHAERPTAPDRPPIWSGCYSCASRFTRHYCVTAAVDRVVFRQPVHVGELVTFLASVNHTGRSSLEVGIRVEAEDIVSGVRRHTTSCYFAMVARDAEGRSVTVPQLDPVTELQQRRWAKAERRRALRLADRDADD